MNWTEERYVRLYKRDTADWLALSFDAQALFCLLLRKVDLAGRLELGRHGPRAIAMIVQQVALWESRLKPALEELIADGCVRVDGETLVMPNYVAAQEAVAAPKLRSAAYRERKAVTGREPVATERDVNDTTYHASSRVVTPAVPAVPTNQIERTPQPPKGGTGNGHRPVKLQKRRRPTLTLAEKLRFEADQLRNDRSEILHDTLRNASMTRDEQLAWCQARFGVGPPEAEDVVRLVEDARAQVEQRSGGAT